MTVSNAVSALPDRELVLDRYRPLRPLGRGGSGSVWLARDERTGLEIALKIVPREGKRASRAAREMEAASRLRHERCVRAYDFGGDSSHVYIAYEYVQGTTMREALRAGQADRPRRGRGIGADPRRPGACTPPRDRAPRREAVQRARRGEDRGLRAAPRFRARPVRRGRYADGRRRRAGTLAYISPERLCGGEATAASDSGPSGCCSGKRSPGNTRSGAYPFRRSPPRSKRARRRSRLSGPISRPCWSR